MSPQAVVEVATLPGTPKDFAFSEEEMIEMAKKLFHVDESGVKNSDALAADFRFEFPIVSLGKKEFIKAVSSFKIKDAFPDMEAHPYHWRVDPYEPHRVWFTCRTTGTHTGALKFFKSQYRPTGKLVLGAPECMSYTFNAAGKCTSYTGGYVMDRRVGNTKGLGAMFGILAAIGGPVLAPGSFTFLSLVAANKVQKLFGKVFNMLTFGRFKGKVEKDE
ncbi:MAG: hypothetical protein WDW38_011390 [Sanguina aurantia]